MGTEAMILATYDDPQWVHEFLGILQRRKRVFVRRLVHCDLAAHLRPLRGAVRLRAD